MVNQENLNTLQRFSTELTAPASYYIFSALEMGLIFVILAGAAKTVYILL
jgi:hypothetical protein